MKRRLKKMQIPDPGQKIAEARKNSKHNTYTWHDPLTAEDKKGGIYDEQQKTMAPALPGIP